MPLPWPGINAEKGFGWQKRYSRLNAARHHGSFIPVTPFEQETWEDPFVVGQNRDRTDINSYGVKMAAEHILGSGLSIKYGWARQFGFKKFRIDWFNAFFKGNSNIDLYDSSNFVTALGLGYTF